MANTSPIGIFDSGIGGLSIAHQIREMLPNENLLYVADSGHAPYGDKSEENILQRSSSIVEFLQERGAKAVVVACNTVTVSAISQLRSKFSVPIIGVEPGVKPAALHSQTGVVGVLATTQTLNSGSFRSLAELFSPDARVEIQSCPGLVEKVEALAFDGEETRKLVQQYVLPLVKKGADSIVLGCTHYAFLLPVIKQVAGPDVEIINTDIAVARQTARRLEMESLLTDAAEPGREEFWSSGARDVALERFAGLWRQSVEVNHFAR